jgi:choline kinase
MKAVILSAGQGKRLLPMTADNPKCLLNIDGQSLIEWQIDELSKGGINHVSVVVGYHADRVAKRLHDRYDPQRVRVLYNPTYAWTDNLVSCWVARAEMVEDFVLLNGDTLFEAAVLNRLLNAPVHPVTVVTHQKKFYDADDMKVTMEGDRLVNIGKELDSDVIDGESIGMLLFRGEGPFLFRHAVENALRDPSASKKWYLSVIDDMAGTIPVWTCSINGLQWCEVDFPADLNQAQKVVQACSAAKRVGESLYSANSLYRYAWREKNRKVSGFRNNLFH